jgi:hypothetical protein
MKHSFSLLLVNEWPAISHATMDYNFCVGNVILQMKKP